MNIGKNIFELRKERKMTQAQLAEKLGVSEQAVSKWENDVCAPDVSLFPSIAALFKVSIDRIYGFHITGYNDEVESIMRAADNSRDTYKEIEIISEGLERYPNSPQLKIYLSFSLSMVNRFSKDENEKKTSINKAINLCNEVVNTCGDKDQVNDALNMLRRIYVDLGEYDKALDAVEKMSADDFCDRIRGFAAVFAKTKSASEFEAYAENNLWKLFFTTDWLIGNMTETAFKNENYKRAVQLLTARIALLSMFDDGCDNFNIAHKIDTCDMRAKAYMKLNDKKSCLDELGRLFELAKTEKLIPKSTDYRVSARNPMYFGNVDDNYFEENFIDFRIESRLKKYEVFFGDDEEYAKIKSRI